MHSTGSPLYMFVISWRFGASCKTLVGNPLETRNRAPFLFIERAPPVLVSLYGVDALPFLSSFNTALFVFCAAMMPPSLVATIPSALLPVPVQMDFHFLPAAMTPGISVTAYSLCSGGPAVAFAGAAPPRPPAPAPPCAAAPRAGPPPRGGGGTLHCFMIQS